MLPIILPFPVSIGRFSLASTTAIAGLLGGEEAVLAMSTIHFYKHRPWAGLYNAPGSYMIARHLDKMGILGSNGSAACSLVLDEKGPEYNAPLSGTHMVSTGHLAYLMMSWSKKLKPESDRIGERTTKPCYVAYLAVNNVDYDTSVQNHAPPSNTLPGLIPVIVSISTCAVCLLIHDWFSLAATLIGMACGGWANFVIGKGQLKIKSVSHPSPGAPPGHGILKGEEDLVVIKGKERDVNAITKGSFAISHLSHGFREQDGATGVDPSYYTNTPHALASIFFVQFLVQLLLAPQGQLLGQFMFIFSLTVSWWRNRHLSSTRLEIQTDMVSKLGQLSMRRFYVGTRTTMVVFACLLLFHEVGRGQDVEKQKEKERDSELRKKFLHSYLPNNTAVWARWTQKVVNQLLSISSDHCETQEFLFLQSNDKDVVGFDEDERKLFNRLLSDAAEAFTGYFKVRGNLPKDSTSRK